MAINSPGVSVGRHSSPLAELQLLSLILTRGDFGAAVMDKCETRQVTPSFFSVSSYSRIFEVVTRLRQRPDCSAIDIPMVYLEAARSQIEISQQVMEQIEDCAANEEAEEYLIDTVCEMAKLRALQRHISKYAQKLSEPVESSGGLIDSFVNDTHRISELSAGVTSCTVGTALEAAMPMLQRLMDGKAIGVETGMKTLDTITRGFAPGSLTILAARPSVGKTAMAINWALGMAENEPADSTADTLIFSLETTKDKLAARVLMNVARISSGKLRDGLLNQAALEKAKAKIHALPLLICDEFNLTISQLSAEARRMHARRKLRAIFVDYLQLLKFAGDAGTPREQVVSSFSRGLKGLAKDLDIPVIVLSQLNRDSEREDRRPRLSDLRESGALEQDADIVILLSRSSSGSLVTSDIINVDVAKNRDGAVGEVPYVFQKDCGYFRDPTSGELQAR